MDIILAFVVFPVSLAVVIVATHYFLRSVRHLGVAFGVSPFVAGSFIAAFGTSFPEVAISLFSVLNGAVSVPVAHMVGSNVANILLVLGVSALIVRRFVISRKLVSVELPIVVAVLLLFVFVVFDGTVFFYEGLFLLAGFLCYAIYIFRSNGNLSYPMTSQQQIKGISSIPQHVVLFFVTAIVIAVASYFTIGAVQTISSLFFVSEGVVAFTVLAFGTSFPELVVSVQAALRNEIDFIIGNVVGSNIFNLLFAVGIPALITNLVVDPTVLSVGIPALVGVVVLLVVSGLSQRIYTWEAVFYLLLYLLLAGKMVGIL